MGFEVAVVGAGRWGTALGAAAARNGHAVTLWSPRKGLANVAGCSRTEHLRDIANKRVIIFTVAPEHARQMARDMAPFVGPEAVILHAVRGLTDDPVATIGDVIQQETCVRRIGALGGPVLVSELEEGAPTLFVCGSPFPEVNALAKELLGSKATRVATTPDRRGVEWSSALVACLALGVGYVQGAGFGPGLVSAVTRPPCLGSRVTATSSPPWRKRVAQRSSSAERLRAESLWKRLKKPLANVSSQRTLPPNSCVGRKPTNSRSRCLGRSRAEPFRESPPATWSRAG